MKKPIALILCGGSGERMRPWSDKRHKCLFGVEGGETALARHLRYVRNLCKPVVFAPADRWSEFEGYEAEFFFEKKQAGTGSKLLATVRRYPGRNILVVYGDIWFHESCYERMLTHLAYTENIRLMTELVPRERKDWRGIIGVSDRDVVCVPSTAGYDKVRFPQFHAALDCFGTDVLKRLARRLRGPDLDLMDDVVQHAIAHGDHVEAVHFPYLPETVSADLGTPDRYARYVCRAYRQKIGFPDILGEAEAALAVARAKRVLTLGNGGSAHIALHAALDWAKAGGKWTECLAEVGLVTAHGNDDGFENSFSNQLTAKRISTGDVLVCFSASGDSPNVVKAATAARALGAQVVGVTGVFPNRLLPLCNVAAVIPHKLNAGTWGYGPIEDGMQVWAHAVTAILEGLRP